jgi:hypothetical protein
MLKAVYRVSAMTIIAVSTLLVSPTISKQNDRLEAYELTASNFVGRKESIAVIKTTLEARNDDRAERLGKFLQSQGSPMASNATDLVNIADKYGLDWRLLPAIAGVESTYARVVPSGSYNPYGWSNGRYCFQNWVVASDYVASQIRNLWGSGEITPWGIGPSYAASPTWAARVSSNMRVIGQYQ